MSFLKTGTRIRRGLKCGLDWDGAGGGFLATCYVLLIGGGEP